MIIDRVEGTAVITQEEPVLSVFIEQIQEQYSAFKNDQLIISVSSLHKIEAQHLAQFLSVSNAHRALNKSFVIVADVDYESVPDELVVVPTMQEAYDMIEMESIERDLGI